MLRRREALKELGQVSFSLSVLEGKGKELDATDEPDRWHPLRVGGEREGQSFALSVASR